MIPLRLLKSFPKVAIVGSVIGISTVAFLYWKMFRTPEKREVAKVQEEQRKEEIVKKAAIAAERIQNLFLMDGDLMDAMTGEVIFDNWLGGDVPSDIYYDSKSKSLIAGYPRGIARYGLDGEKQGELAVKYPCGFTEGFQAVLYAKDKDVWWADVDVEKLKLTRERQITKSGLIHEPYFAQNIIVATEKTLVIKNLNQQIKISMETGDMKPYGIPLNGIQRRRSPDGKWIVGEQSNHFYIHEVDTEAVKSFPIGRFSIVDYQWLNNERGVFILRGQQVMMFNRVKGELDEIASLPYVCTVIANPSPTGRFVFCASNQGAVLLDLESKKLEATPLGGTDFVWMGEDSYLFRRDVIDSSLRGTWIKTFGKPETRITEQPFLIDRNAVPILAKLKPVNLLVFATREGLNRLKLDGSDFAEVAKASSPPARLLGIREWGLDP